MKRRKSWIVLLVACVGLLILVGFGSKPVKLLNERPPLIDLDAAIVEAKFGNNGNEAHEDGEDPTQTSNDQKPDKRITIRVRGELIWYGETQCDEKQLITFLRNYKNDDGVRLVDDYAERNCIRNVLAQLEEFNIPLKDGIERW